MRNSLIPLFIFILFCSSFGCRNKNKLKEDESYINEIKQWQEKRISQIGNENGWLSLAGLFWLEQGENYFGTDSTNTIIFPPGTSQKKAGTIILDGEKLTLKAFKGTDIRYQDSIVSKLQLVSDESGRAKPTVLTIGPLSFHVIKRGEQFAVRLKNRENPPLKKYKGLEFFPINSKYKIEARYITYPQPKILNIVSIIGTVTPETCKGALEFKIEGKSCRLEAISENESKELYIMFTDETTGKETYSNGRQLMAAFPDKEGKVILDFNKAYNWPCAYTPYATCPIPPKENHLPVRIEAGEKKYPENTDH